MKINAGCGPFTREGYVNVDLYWNQDGIVVDDVRTLRTFEDGCAEEVYCSHVLEHLGHEDGIKAIKTFHRVLMCGGHLEIIVPDFPKMVAMWMSQYHNGLGIPAMPIFTMYTIFGQQIHEGEFHKWGYDVYSLDGLLHSVEFGWIEITDCPGLYDGVWKDGLCLSATAIKP